MNTLEDLIRYESPHSGLKFRKTIYGPRDDARLIADCIALANAAVNGRRYVVMGVYADHDRRRLVGIEKDELARFKRRFSKLIAGFVEPELNAAVRGVEIDGRYYGYIRIKECDAVPYLVKQPLAGVLSAGMGFIRRGMQNQPLTRPDMQRMFARAKDAPQSEPMLVRVGFHGSEPEERLNVPVLPINKLPSELAAERVKAMIASKDLSREMFGRTETRMSRLMHAKLYGVDTPFEKHGDDTLAAALETVDADYAAADLHYLYEVRAHKLNFMVVNEGDTNLHDARLSLSLPATDGVGIADRVYTETDTELAPSGYPELSAGARSLTLAASLGTLYAGRRVRAFQEPARLWVRDEAAGKAIPVDYELTADELEKPVTGNLVIYIDRASLRSV